MSASQEGLIIMDFAAGDSSPRLCFVDVRFRTHFNCFCLITGRWTDDCVPTFNNSVINRRYI